MDKYGEIEESFWGVCLEPGKKYSQTVEKSVHVSMAAVDPSAKGSKEQTSLWLKKDATSYLLCSLGHPSYQQNLDLNFTEGETVCLFSKGTSTIHLTGYLHLDSDFPSDDDFEAGEGEEDEDDFLSDEAEEEEEDLKEVVEPKIEASKRKQLFQKQSQKTKKAKLIEADSDNEDDDLKDNDEEMDDDDDEEEEVVKPTPVKNTPKKQEQKADPGAGGDGSEKKKKKRKKKKKNKEGGEENGADDSAKNTPQKGGQTPKATPQKGGKRVLEGGVVVETVKEGHGPEAAAGKNVKVYYTGKLESGKIFDSKTSGSPFSFKLGKKEVIPGWDVGIAGMKVGSKCKLTVPAKMGYGSQKLSGIPANSTLVFDVELKAVK